jgi:hypothetical protein
MKNVFKLFCCNSIRASTDWKDVVQSAKDERKPSEVPPEK